MPHAMVAAPFKNVPETNKIALDVSGWVLKRVANTRLGRQIHDHLRRFLSEQRHQGLALLKGHGLEPPGLLRSHRLDLSQTCMFQRGVVIAVEIVNTNNTIALLEQTLG